MAAVRRHFIIEPRFQAGFTFAFVRGMLLAVAIPAALLFVAVQILAKNPSLTDAQRLALSGAIESLALLFVIVAGAMGALAAIIGLIISHRYAGPLKRIESWAARHLLGQPREELVLRPRDEMASVAATLERIIRKEDQP